MNKTIKTAVKIITFVGGLFFILEFVIPGYRDDDTNFLSPALPQVSTFLMVLAAMAFLLGPLNLIRNHVGRIANSKKGWHNSIIFLVFLAFGIFAKTTDVAAKNLIVLKVLQNEQTESWAQDWQFQLRVCDSIGTAALAADRPATQIEPAATTAK